MVAVLNVRMESFVVTARSHSRGHEIEYNGDKWVYKDDKSSISVERPCVWCGQMPTPEGYDACIGYIPGKHSVCCGHGKKNPIIL